MSNTTAKIFRTGRSQAVRLPAAYRFEGVDEVFIRRDPESGDIILSARPTDWQSFFDALKDTEVPADFLSEAERAAGMKGRDRDPFAEWRE